MTDDLYQEVVPGDLIYNDGDVGLVYGSTKSNEIRYLKGYIPWRENEEKEVVLDKLYSRANHYNFKITEEQLRHYLLGAHRREQNLEENEKIVEKLLEAQREMLNQ